jgi:hypothetical protein
MHAFLMKPPAGMQVDHINGDPLDNRRSNLRICTRQENLRNRRITHGRSKYKGVRWYQGRWTASIKVACNSEREAAELFNKLAQVAYGEFASLNELDDQA